MVFSEFDGVRLLDELLDGEPVAIFTLSIVELTPDSIAPPISPESVDVATSTTPDTAVPTTPAVLPTTVSAPPITLRAVVASYFSGSLSSLFDD